jgi:hypothetical protein
MTVAPSVNPATFFVGRNDFMLMRYADIWLMKAEAMFRYGQFGSMDQFNELHKIRGVEELSTLSRSFIGRKGI